MKRIEGQTQHDVLVTGDHDDRARQDFAFTFRNYVTSELMPSNRVVFDRRAAKTFKAQNGREIETSKDVRAAMSQDDYFKFYASARRTSQELIWSSVTPAVEAALPELGQKMREGFSGKGQLELNPDLAIPKYAKAIDIHCMPGGYASDLGEGDVAAGAVYDRGVYLYMSGLMGPNNDGVGQLAARYLKARFPGMAPKRILDMGCGVGHATLPYKDVFPDAEVVGIDVGPALLRYAHARANSMGAEVDFIQANAEATNWPNGHFDLVTSHIFLHETSSVALPAVLAESHRLLAPGGLMAHIDQPRFVGLDPYQSFMQENETYYNNEPFWTAYRKLDLEALAMKAGFSADQVETDVLVAAVIQQSQNNQKIAAGDPEAKKRGFQILLGHK
jgi:ubiquinone/menaquinone biosynthesis C-methylase UbiE